MLFCFLIVLLNTNKICEGNPDVCIKFHIDAIAN